MVGERTLAAIVFTDVEGFTARASDNEALAYARLSDDFDAMTEVTLATHGRVLKTMGDGMLMAFATASDAVDCALMIQQRFDGRDSTHLRHRIGVHLGDLLLTENDAHGDGVNVASRLQAEASPGGVVLSQTVYDIVRGRLQIQVMDLGERRLKNLPDPVRLFEVRPANAPKVPRRTQERGSSGLPSAMFFLGCCILVAVAAFWFRDSSPAAVRAAQADLASSSDLNRGDVQRLIAMNSERQQRATSTAARPVADVPEAPPQTVEGLLEGNQRREVPPSAKPITPKKEAVTAPRSPEPPAGPKKGTSAPLSVGSPPATPPERWAELRKAMAAHPELKDLEAHVEKTLRHLPMPVMDPEAMAEMKSLAAEMEEGGAAYEKARLDFAPRYQADQMLSWLEKFEPWHGTPVYTRVVSHWSNLNEFMVSVRRHLRERGNKPITVTTPRLGGQTMTFVSLGDDRLEVTTRRGTNASRVLSELEPPILRALAAALFGEDGLSENEVRMLGAFDREYGRQVRVQFRGKP